MRSGISLLDLIDITQPLVVSILIMNRPKVFSPENTRTFIHSNRNRRNIILAWDDIREYPVFPTIHDFGQILLGTNPKASVVETVLLPILRQVLRLRCVQMIDNTGIKVSSDYPV